MKGAASPVEQALAPHAGILAIVGKRLTRLCHGELDMDDPLESDDLGPLELGFDDGSSLQARLISDGESATYAIHATRPARLYAQNCDWRRVDLSERVPYRALPGARIVAIDALLFGAPIASDCVVAGYVFHFDHGHRLSYYNAGDTAHIYFDALPPTLRPPFELRALRIAGRA